LRQNKSISISFNLCCDEIEFFFIQTKNHLSVIFCFIQNLKLLNPYAVREVSFFNDQAVVAYCAGDKKVKRRRNATDLEVV